MNSSSSELKENPRVKPKILCVGFFMKNAATAPIVVEIPAKKDNNNANKTTPLTFSSPYFLAKATKRTFLQSMFKPYCYRYYIKSPDTSQWPFLKPF